MSQIELVEKMNKFGRGTVVDVLSFIISNMYFLIALFGGLCVLVILQNPAIGWPLLYTFTLAMAIHFFTNDFLIKRVLRKFFYKARPFNESKKIKSIGARHNDSTFPSGHMSSLTALLVVLFHYYPQTWPVSVFFLVLIGLSRLHNGMHFPADVIFGVFFGLGYAYLAIVIFERIFT
jgi:membrane-associated phospholipid phosphatase